MIVNDPNGDAQRVGPDGRATDLSVIQTDLNALADVGLAWTLPFTQDAVDTTDNVVFHFENTSTEDFDFMRLIVSASGAGLWTVETDRAYGSGGTTLNLAPLKTLSGKVQAMTAYYGQDVILTGTAEDLFYVRVAADTPVDLLAYGPIVVQSSGTLAIKFNADAGTPTMGVTPILHGKPPWKV